MTIFMSFQWLRGKMKACSARFASAVSFRTWVQRRPLSNRQVLMGPFFARIPYLISCKLLARVALGADVVVPRVVLNAGYLTSTIGVRPRRRSGHPSLDFRSGTPNGAVSSLSN